jgi:phosphoserine aminotransferase
MHQMSDIYNFSPGPAILPKEVLRQAQEELLDYEGSGISIIESSHRGAEYSAVHQEAQANIRKLLSVSDDYAVLFLQGGASHQFAMIPMNFLGKGQIADYTLSGAWAKKAIAEAKNVGQVHLAADTDKDRPTRVPAPDALDLTDDAAYLHLTSNETISGAQWKTFPDSKVPIIADMSSDILSRTLDVSRFSLIYAGAQKNMGPSGVATVIIRKDLAEHGAKDLPSILRYQTHIDNDSLYHTPPSFSIYIMCLVTRWLLAKGGVSAMEKINEEKAGALYSAIDATDFYTGAAERAHRSLMNVTFNLPTPDLEAQFAKEADAAGLKGLEGHRSVGGLRASIYNAFPHEGVDALLTFMADFEKQNG